MTGHIRRSSTTHHCPERNYSMYYFTFDCAHHGLFAQALRVLWCKSSSANSSRGSAPEDERPSRHFSCSICDFPRLSLSKQCLPGLKALSISIRNQVQAMISDPKDVHDTQTFLNRQAFKKTFKNTIRSYSQSMICMRPCSLHWTFSDVPNFCSFGRCCWSVFGLWSSKSFIPLVTKAQDIFFALLLLKLHPANSCQNLRTAESQGNMSCVCLVPSRSMKCL